MSWIQTLYQTYDSYINTELASDPGHPLAPVYHKAETTHVEVTLSDKGEFLTATALYSSDAKGKSKLIKTLIPVSPKSLTARTSGSAPYPLSDRLHYVAKDYAEYKGDNGDPKKSYYNDYEAQLENWCNSSYAHYKAKAVLNYVKKGMLVNDLLKAKLLYLSEKNMLSTEWTLPKQEVSVWESLDHRQKQQMEKDWHEKNPKPQLLQLLKNKKQGEIIVRWKVQTPGKPDDTTWNDKSLQQSWIDYQRSISSNEGLCFITGAQLSIASNHPKNINNRAANAKLISTPTSKGLLTYQGRFTDDTGLQACSVGNEPSQKIHSVLAWLIERQGYHYEKQVYVVWASSGAEIPTPFLSTLELFNEFRVDVQTSDEESITDKRTFLHGDAGQAYASRLKKAIVGYKQNLGPSEGINIIGLDSASDGRMAVVFYRVLNGSEFLKRIEDWHSAFAWNLPASIIQKSQTKTKGDKTKSKISFQYFAPSPENIAKAAYDKPLHDKLIKTTVERILPCIIEGRDFPRDLLESVVRRACRRGSFKREDKEEWEQVLGVACAVYRGYYARVSSMEDRRSYQMTLELDRRTRDYLYGRLLAYAEHIEEKALWLADENRDTTAARLMQRFADHPCSTWRSIEHALLPYKARLRAKWPGYLAKLSKEIDEIIAKFEPAEFERNTKLSGEYLLGYHCQRHNLWHKSPKSDCLNNMTEITSEISEENE